MSDKSTHEPTEWHKNNNKSDWIMYLSLWFQIDLSKKRLFDKYCYKQSLKNLLLYVI